MAESIGDWDRVGAVLFDLGVIYGRQRGVRRQVVALEAYLERFASLTESGRLRPAVAWSLGLLYFQMGRHDRTLPLLEDALVSAEFHCHELLSRCALAAGQLKGAALQLLDQIDADGLEDLGETFSRRVLDPYRYIPESLAGAAPLVLVPIGPL